MKERLRWTEGRTMSTIPWFFHETREGKVKASCFLIDDKSILFRLFESYFFLREIRFDCIFKYKILDWGLVGRIDRVLRGGRDKYAFRDANVAGFEDFYPIVKQLSRPICELISLNVLLFVPLERNHPFRNESEIGLTGLEFSLFSLEVEKVNFSFLSRLLLFFFSIRNPFRGVRLSRRLIASWWKQF